MDNPTDKHTKYILPLDMNDLVGRMIKIPSTGKNKREILLVAGQHTSAERIFGFAEYLNRYGHVTSPDLPGFGGMQSFYSIKRKPDLDSMAAYLASFVKLRYKNKKITIIAFSYGFSVVTKMLQKYPDLSDRIDFVISISGVVNKNDFRWKRNNILAMRLGCFIFSRPGLWRIARAIGTSTPVIKNSYRVAQKKHPKLMNENAPNKEENISFEIGLWKQNDFRTWLISSIDLLTMDLSDSRVNLPVYHVAVDDDHYFNNVVVEQHLRQIYASTTIVDTKLKSHAPTILATPEDVAPFVPAKIRALLRKKV
jgi:pimeloyl-ACP methyl ester carboxylesterase